MKKLTMMILFLSMVLGLAVSVHAGTAASAVQFEFDKASYLSGETMTVRVSFENVLDLAGFQIDLAEDANVEMLTELSPYVLDNGVLSDFQVYVNAVNNGIATFLTLANSTTDLSGKTMLFSFQMHVLTDVSDPTQLFVFTNNFDDILFDTANVCVKLSDSTASPIPYQIHANVYLPSFALIGLSEITQEHGSTYVEEGATFLPGDQVQVSGSVDTHQLGEYTVTYTCILWSGVIWGELTRIVQIVDTTAPVFTLLQESLTLEAGETMPDFTSYVQNLVEDADSNPSVDVFTAMTTTKHVGEYTVVITITDHSGNATSHDLQVTIEDHTAPTFTLPESYSMDEDTVTSFDWTTIATNVEDNSDGAISVSVVSTTVNFQTPGTYQVVLKASDPSGNETTHSMNVIIRDITAPTFSVPSTYELNEDSVSSFDWLTLVTNPLDNSSVAPTLSVFSSNVDFATPGIYQVVVRATDQSGNHVDHTISVTIHDATVPTFNVPESYELDEDSVTSFDWTTLATNVVDNAPGTITLSVVSTNVDFETPGVYQVVIRATDANQLATDHAISVVIRDITPPTFTVPETYEINEDSVTSFDFTSLVTMLSDNAITPPSVSVFSSNVVFDTPGLYLVVIRAVDDAGNRTDHTIAVTIKDVTSPVLVVTTPFTFSLGTYTSFNFASLVISATDNVDLPYYNVLSSNVNFEETGTYQVVIRASDYSGNFQDQTIEVIITAYVPVYYTVRFLSYDGTREVASVEVLAGETIQEEDIPDYYLDGYTFDGWGSGDLLFDFNTPIQADLNLYAFVTIKTGCLSGIFGSFYFNIVSFLGVTTTIIVLRRKNF